MNKGNRCESCAVPLLYVWSAASVDESRSLGNWEGLDAVRRGVFPPKHEPEDLQEIVLLFIEMQDYGNSAVTTICRCGLFVSFEKQHEQKSHLGGDREVLFEEVKCKEQERRWNAKAERAIALLESMTPSERTQYWDYALTMYRKFKPYFDALSDEEVLELLKKRSRELGHIPSQKEIYPPYRYLIRARFKNWPNALRKAGLKEPKKEERHVKEKEK